jgi:hypothetical protein
MVSFMPLPLYPRGKPPRTRRVRGGWASEQFCMLWRKEKFLASAGNQTPIVQPVARRYTDWSTSMPDIFVRSSRLFYTPKLFFPAIYLKDCADLSDSPMQKKVENFKPPSRPEAETILLTYQKMWTFPNLGWNESQINMTYIQKHCIVRVLICFILYISFHTSPLYGVAWTGLIWLRIRTSGELLWIQ